MTFKNLPTNKMGRRQQFVGFVSLPEDVYHVYLVLALHLKPVTLFAFFPQCHCNVLRYNVHTVTASCMKIEANLH